MCSCDLSHKSIIKWYCLKQGWTHGLNLFILQCLCMERFTKISSDMTFLKHSKREQAVLFKEKKQENIAVYRKDAIYTQNDQLEHMYCNSNITADSTCLRASFFLHRHEL